MWFEVSLTFSVSPWVPIIPSPLFSPFFPTDTWREPLVTCHLHAYVRMALLYIPLVCLPLFHLLKP